MTARRRLDALERRHATPQPRAVLRCLEPGEIPTPGALVFTFLLDRPADLAGAERDGVSSRGVSNGNAP